VNKLFLFANSILLGLFTGAAMPEIDKALATELKAARKQPRNFLFIPGRELVLLVSRKKIGGSELNQAKEKAGGGKPVKGRCFGEEKTLVFEMTDNPPSGLDKKIKNAIKASAGLQMTVEVRQVGSVIEEEFAEVTETETPETETTESEGEETTGTDGPEARTPTADPEAVAAKARFKLALQRVQEIFDAIKDSPAAAEKNLAMSLLQAVKLGAAGKYAEGLAALETLEAQCETVQRSNQVAAEIGQQAGGNVVKFRTCRLKWEQARKVAREQMLQLQKAILTDAETQQDAQFNEIKAGVAKLSQELVPFDDSLLAALDEAITAPNEEARAPHNAKCVQIITGYRNALDSSGVLDELDDSEYGNFRVFTSLDAALNEMSALLG